MSSIDAEARKLALQVAATSKAKKRKVGCVIVIDGKIMAQGCNYNPSTVDGACEDVDGATLSTTIHAEDAAVQNFWINSEDIPGKGHAVIYVTHEPCNNCKAILAKFASTAELTSSEVIVVDAGLKFDSGKIDYTLIPAIAIESLATVLHYGAKKYKPNNWRHVDPAKYVQAFERHWKAYLDGEMLDAESGLPHLAHCMTNLAFLLELQHVPARQQTLEDYIKNFTKI